MLWSGVLPTKFGGNRAFLSKLTLPDPFMTFDPSNALRFGQGFFPPNLVATGISMQLTPGWPQLTPAWHLTPAMHYTLVRVLTKFGGYRGLLSKLTPTWPQLTPTWPWPQQCIMLWSGILVTKFGGHKALLSKLTPTWPLHDLWPQQCITLWSGILPTIFGGHRSFLSNLTPGWPQVTLHDFWHQQRTTLLSGVLLSKFGSHRAFLRQIDPFMTYDLRWVCFKICPQTSWAHPLPPCQLSARYLKAWQNV